MVVVRYRRVVEPTRPDNNNLPEIVVGQERGPIFHRVPDTKPLEGLRHSVDKGPVLIHLSPSP